MEDGLATWQLQDAQARFDEFVDASMRGEPQIIVSHNIELAVLLPVADLRRENPERRPSLKQLLLSDDGPRDLLVPERGKYDQGPSEGSDVTGTS